MAAPKFYEGQEFHNPADPSAPVLVFHGGKFFPKDASGAATGLPAPKLSPEDAAGLKALVQEVQARQLLASRADEFMSKQAHGAKDGGAVSTGPVYGDTPVINHVLPNVARMVTNVIDPDKASTLQELDSINNSTWTALRPTGSGPIRNYEASGWKKAFPNPANFGTANADITERLRKEYEEGRNQLQFIQNFVRSGKGGYGDAQAAWLTSQQAAPTPSGNDMLKARSAKARAPVSAGAMVDIFGKPVGP